MGRHFGGCSGPVNWALAWLGADARSNDPGLTQYSGNRLGTDFVGLLRDPQRPAIFLIGLGAFFPAAVNTTHGVRQIDATLYKAACMMGANERELVVRVILPGALPSIMTGIRLSMGIAWVLVVVAEILAVRSGLGYLLNDSYSFYRNDVVIAAMLSIGLLGFFSDLLVVRVRDRLLAWNRMETFRV